MGYHDIEYKKLVSKIRSLGELKKDRTGTGCYSLFGEEMQFYVHDSIPLLTMKKMHVDSIIHELIWFLSGDPNIKYLRDNNVKIWDLWATEDGDLGPIYGPNWRDWNGIDQLQSVIDSLNDNPNSRRHVVSAWNPEFLPDESRLPQENVEDGKGALAPCHAFFQFYSIHGKLSLKLTQRSADVFLGVPFNIAQYTMLLYVVCALTNHTPHKFIWSGGDVHIYKNHLDAVDELLTRDPMMYRNPSLDLFKFNSIDELTFDHFDVKYYEHQDPIRAKVAY